MSFRVGGDVAASPPPGRRRAPGAGARYAGGAVVLLCAADVVRHVRCRDDVVELRRRVRLARPRLAAIDRHVAAAVVRIDHPRGVVRGNPQVVVVPVRHPSRADGLGRVGGTIDSGVENVDRVFGLRIRVDARVIERPLPQTTVVVDELPGRAGVVGQEHAPVARLDDRVDARRIRARDRHPDFSPGRLRQPRVVGQCRPRPPAVGRLVEAAAGTAARERVRRPIDLPEPRTGSPSLASIENRPRRSSRRGRATGSRSCRCRPDLKTPRSRFGP